MEKCKRCLLREASKEDIYEDIQARIKKLSEKDRASKEQYNARIEQCKMCEHLIAGVCQKCGCYIEFRSAFKNQHCPLPSKTKKW